MKKKFFFLAFTLFFLGGVFSFVPTTFAQNNPLSCANFGVVQATPPITCSTSARPVRGVEALSPGGTICCMTQSEANRLRQVFLAQQPGVPPQDAACVAAGGQCVNVTFSCPTGTSVNGSCSIGNCCRPTSNGDGPGGGPTNPGGGGPTNPGGGGPTTPNAPGTAGSLTINFGNPLKYDTVDEVLGSVLAILRNIVVLLALIFIVIGGILYITSGGNEKRTGTAKAAITAALIGLAIVLAAPSFLREIYEAIGGTVKLPGEVAEALTLTQIATNVLNFLLGIVGVLAIIMLLVGAIMYFRAAGDEKRAETGKNIVKYSVIGIIVAFAALVLVTQVAEFFI